MTTDVSPTSPENDETATSEAASNALARKSVQAAVAAIEIYNKPDFAYREEAFSLLMTNAWELLLKAKWLLDHSDDITSLHETESDPSDANKRRPKLNRCGNPITFGATYLAAKLLSDVNSGYGENCHENLMGLLEIRDNAAHFVNKDVNFGRRVLEFGTASLQNYLRLVTEWMNFDLSRYNFFLMPLSFYHGFEAVVSASVSPYDEQERRLLEYLDGLACDEDAASADNDYGVVTMRIKTSLVRGKNDDGMTFRWTNDPHAQTLSITEDDVLKNYPYDYKSLTAALRRRYNDFVENAKYHKYRKEFGKEKKFCIERLLDPSKDRGLKKRFYNPNILAEFDKHYTKRKKS